MTVRCKSAIYDIFAFDYSVSKRFEFLSRKRLCSPIFGCFETFRNTLIPFFTVLQYIEHLLFDLLQNVLHFHHNDLHFALVALAAEGVDFAAHLLGDKA